MQIIYYVLCTMRTFNTHLRTFHITVQRLIKPTGPQKILPPVTFPMANIYVHMYDDNYNIICDWLWENLPVMHKDN